MSSSVRGTLATVVVALLVAACAAEPAPTPVPTSVPTAAPEAAGPVVDAYLAAWRASDFEAMHALLAPADVERHPPERFVGLHRQFADLAAARLESVSVGALEPTALPPEPRPPDLPPPPPPPTPTPDPAAPPGTAPPPTLEPDPGAIIAGPVPALAVTAQLVFESDRFGTFELERRIVMTQGADGWQIRWQPQSLFEELGAAGTFALERTRPTRGQIVSEDGTLFATNRDDGMRVYPQETLAGQVIGYLSEVTAEDLERLAGLDYRAGDVVGRSGLEAGAEELLRGSPGYQLYAVPGDGPSVELLSRPVVPGADLTITLRPELQRAAETGLAAYAQGATAALDPQSGDVWVLASQPTFNPNAGTLGTSLDGEPLPDPEFARLRNKALLGAYPAGSAFKPFALVAALKTGTVTHASLVTCPPTWQYGTYTFRNYENHELPGQVTLAQAMAFSCNTTYMPLGFEVYQRDPTALLDLLFEFGFGQPTGIGYLAEDPGVVPDDEWLRANNRGGYSGFEQIQLSIGQGAFLGTQLQLANAYAAIGNGGTLWTPRIVTSATLPDGTLVAQVEPSVGQQISVGAEELAYVTETMRAVVTLPYGTATSAFAGFPIPVAGKSGTAETGTPDPHAVFPAFAPVDDPTISVSTILLHTPLATGGANAAPLVRRVMAEHFAAE